MISRTWRIMASLFLLGTGFAYGYSGQFDQASPESIIRTFSGEWELEVAEFMAIEEAIDVSLEEMRAAAINNVHDEDKNVRFAALYVLARTAVEGDSMDALFPFLESVDISERITAAEALLIRGEKASFPILIDALDSSEYLSFRDPPQRAWEAAVFALIQFTNEDLGLLGVEDIEGSQAAQGAWSAWWQENQDSLTWDQDIEVFQ